MEARPKQSNRVYSLREISREFNALVVDAPTLISYEYRNPHMSLDEKTSLSIRRRENALFFREFLEEGGNLYVPSSVLDNYFCESFSFPVGSNSSRELLSFSKAIEMEQKEGSRLANAFRKYGRVLDYEESDKSTYDRFSNKYAPVARNIRNLTDDDFDFLIQALTLFRDKGSCALLSRNYRILYAWNDFFGIEGNTFPEFWLFLSTGVDSFKKAEFKPQTR